MPGPRYPSADPEWRPAIQREWRAFTPSTIARAMSQTDVPECVRLYALKDRAERLFALSATQTGREQLATLRGHSKMMREIRMLSRQLGIGSVASRGKRRSEAADALVPPIGTRLDDFNHMTKEGNLLYTAGWHAEQERARVAGVPFVDAYAAKWGPVTTLQAKFEREGMPPQEAYRAAWLAAWPNGYQEPAPADLNQEPAAN